MLVLITAPKNPYLAQPAALFLGNGEDTKWITRIGEERTEALIFKLCPHFLTC